MRPAVMNALAQHIEAEPPAQFVSAYRQLWPAERVYVDGYVAELERQADRRGERISNALYGVIPADIVAASRGMLDKPMVRAAITERITQIAADSELTVRRIVRELTALAFTNIADFQVIGADGMPYYDFSRATPEQLKAISAIEFEETLTLRGPQRKLKIKMHDKLGALDKLAKYVGMFEPDNPHWRADNATPSNVEYLPGHTTTNEAADLYGRMIDD